MPTWDATVDYVIVGAGSAGCVLANRLSASDAHLDLSLAHIDCELSSVRYWYEEFERKPLNVRYIVLSASPI